MTGKIRAYTTRLGIAQIVSYGTLYYSFPQIAAKMMERFGWEKAEVYEALTAAFIAAAITTLPFGKAIDKGFGKQIMTYGSMAAGLLLLAWAAVSSLLSLYIVMIGIGFTHSAPST